MGLIDRLSKAQKLIPIPMRLEYKREIEMLRFASSMFDNLLIKLKVSEKLLVTRDICNNLARQSVSEYHEEQCMIQTPDMDDELDS